MGTRLAELALGIATVAFLLAPLAYWDGGLLEREATDFVPRYLDDRALPQKIFDPAGNDYGNYQARELSYLLDLLDAHALRWLLARGIVVFVPASAILAVAATVLIFLVGARKALPALDPTTATLALLLYLSNYALVATTGMLYRSAKPALAPVLLATALFLLHVARARGAPGVDRPSGGAVGPALIVFAAGCLMSLLDRQGFFYLGVLCAALALLQLRCGGCGDLLAAGLGALGLMLLYNLVLAPASIHAANGYWPDFGYQRIPLGELAAHPEYLLQGTALAIQATALLLGGLPAWGYLAASIALAAARGRPSLYSGAGSAAGGRRLAAAIRGLFSREEWTLIGLLAVSQVALWTLMVVRHPPVFGYEDHRLWYYPLPYQALALAGLAWLLDRARPFLRGGWASAIQLVLAGMIAANVAGWERHRDAMLGSYWFPAIYEQSSLLKQSLRRGEPHLRLDDDYRAFYAYLRSPLPPAQWPRRRAGAAATRLPLAARSREGTRRACRDLTSRAPRSTRSRGYSSVTACQGRVNRRAATGSGNVALADRAGSRRAGAVRAPAPTPARLPVGRPVTRARPVQLRASCGMQGLRGLA